MSSGTTWSLKGIDSETRQAVKEAASKSGLAMGEWLNQFIREAAAQNSVPATQKQMAGEPKTKSKKKARRKKSSSPAGYEDLLNRLSGRRSGDLDTLASINLRLEASEKHALDAVRAAATQAVYSRLGNLDEKISSAREDRIKVASRAGDADYQAIENTLQKVVDRLEVSEKQNRETARAMQEYIAQMATKSHPSMSGVTDSDAADFMNLEERVSELARRIGAQKG